MLAALGELRPWFQGDDPQVSVYLTTDGAIENAAVVKANRWAKVRDGLHKDRAPDDVLTAVDELVPDAHRAGKCLAVFGGSRPALYVEHGTEPPPRDFARCDSLPAMGLVLKWRQAQPSFVVVLADRRGANITMVSADGATSAHTVEGSPREPLRKVQPGGWSQRRYQQRAQNTWEHHAREIADDVQRAVDAVRAELVVVAGDVREVQLLEEHLPPRVAALIGAALATGADIRIVPAHGGPAEGIGGLLRWT